ncbi:SusF/SusE family outer membrane protein [Flavobacterium sp. NST-5]|uniref:SusF/SusE family outer membrane protein n=1 Tax=Flavobacterium ichthyis TaxID=2698827 RepID=A0ABW9Z7E7_9FLAO|nr:SusE domain-containing protein [Flavobacterium ichthyis]NBL64599.1 SusF/SusE family outer membrane protein [Flavobacterium ichthyis]
MKNITKSIIALFTVFAVACSSDDVEDRPVIMPVDAPVLLAPENGNSYVLTVENATMQAERFVWSAANFDQDVAITYEVEIDSTGHDFDNPASLGSTVGGSQLSVSVETLNNAVSSVGGMAFEEGTFDVRVKASVNGTFEPMYSNVMTISVTPYVALDPELFMVGAIQGSYGLGEWDNTTAIPMRYVGNGTTKVFEAYVKVNTGQGFKFIGEQGTWDNGNYGTIGGAQDGVLENSGGSSDLKVADVDGPGLYYVRVDIDALTYKAVKMNWGVIGDATPAGWGDETPMTYDFATNLYTFTGTLANGELKMRSKNVGQAIYSEDWKFAVGNSAEKFAYDTGAPNFPITAGSYTITLSIDFDGTATVTGL